MKKGDFKTIEQVWNAIESGQEVFWSNEGYHLTIELSQHYSPKFTEKNGKLLRVTCKENYFGSLLLADELPLLFTKEKPKDTYISSIINKYGDRDNVPKDCKTIYDIINRQGTSLLIDCIAEHVGSVSLKYNMTTSERELLVSKLVAELNSALYERL